MSSSLTTKFLIFKLAQAAELIIACMYALISGLLPLLSVYQ